jgi:uncharacterized protein (TIGR03435 family)
MTSRYDVEAKAERITSSDQMRPMLQALLADRFKLAVRREDGGESTNWYPRAAA